MTTKLVASVNTLPLCAHPNQIGSAYMTKMNFPRDSAFSAMDIGCGGGRVLYEILHPLLPRNCTELIGTDMDSSMIDHCRSLQAIANNVSFEQMDFTTKNLPDKFKKRFHSLFSSYCLTYVTDFRQALINSRDMLTADGELLFIFMYKKNQLYTTYREMSKKDIWKTYTKEYANFEPHFSGVDPDSQLHSQFAEAGLRVLAHEFKPDVYFEAHAGTFVEVYKSLDTIYHRIPQDKKQQYMNDFDHILGDETGLPVGDELKLQEMCKFNFPSAIVHARRITAHD